MRHGIAALIIMWLMGVPAAFGLPPPPDPIPDPAPKPAPAPAPATDKADDAPLEEPVLAADRPTFSEGAATVTHHFVQVEFGVEYQLAPLEDAMALPLALLRWGVGESSEIRLYIPSIGVRWPKDAATLTDVGAVGLGFKYGWDVADGFAVAVSPFLFLPLKSDQYETEGVSLGARLIAGLRFTDWMGATFNGGITIAGLGGNSLADKRLYALSLALDFALIDSLSFFAEVFSAISDQKGEDAPVNVDLGLTWALSPRWQVDIYGGMNTLEAPDELFFGLGAVFLW